MQNALATGDDRVINATGKYLIPEDQDIEEFDFVDNFENGELAEEDHSMINRVVQAYDGVLQGGIQKMPSVVDEP